ncbi:MAG TPA: N-succinylarginine dihydrolase [Casimicrobiaceae bacterium]|nr:N-succinylarginine dihydrolase [Casimicrobiaceae bacterium]
MNTTDVNFDGIPGPTHNYAGLAEGNLAAARNANLMANPREAALQGLAKMRALATRGYAQAVLPPHERPYVPALRELGFHGSDVEIIARAARDAPRLLASASSAAAMWAANAATVSASSDANDGRVHFTPANLVSHFHRSIEADTTMRVLRAIFADESRFVVHDPLPSAMQLGDEGAANHMRLFADGRAIDVFVYGRSNNGGQQPMRFHARQAREASEAIARRHGLQSTRFLFAQQRPDVIDAGVFHNDVIAVSYGHVLLCHERAYVQQEDVVAACRNALGPTFMPIIVTDADVPLDDAVTTYLFNSQLLPRDDGSLLLVTPGDVNEHARVRAYIERLVASGGPVTETIAFDLRQSMRNGGGPACLRLRVPLADDECNAISARVMLDEGLAVEIERWIRAHYRDRLAPADLADPALLDESRRALDELTRLLRLPSLYRFQR